jgi:Zn-dependent protease with chaperone function
MMSSQPASLRNALTAFKQKNFTEAINLLEEILQDPHSLSPSDLSQAQMTLVKAYQQNGALEQAIALCQQLIAQGDLQVQAWADKALPALLKARETELPNDEMTADEPDISQELPKAGRAAAGAIATLSIAKAAANLAFASSATLISLVGMVLVLSLAVFLIVTGENPVTGLVVAIAITVVFSVGMFFLSPLLMDLVQNWLYKTKWVSLEDVKRLSPESAQIIQRVCQQKGIQQPRLGIIDDRNPTAFTYGSLPNTARLVVSKGLFTYLDDDEVATVYAHELGHIVHWDFAVMTLGATLTQILYLIYIFARRMSDGGSKNQVKDALGHAAMMAYVFHLIGTYLLLFLSRTREYYADHFAAEITGNPNGLSRALVKIAYGIVEEGKRSKEPSRLVEGTRALGIYDPKVATSTGTAYRIASSPAKVGRVFLWDMFNPWAWWMELSSTHPLTGKRIRALSTYAEQLGLEMEFDMGRVMAEGRQLNQRRLNQTFAVDLLLYVAPWIGVVPGLLIAMVGFVVGSPMSVAGLTFVLISFGIGMLTQMVFMFPDFNKAPETDVLTLMSDPYASPLRGQPVKLQGELIGRGDAGSKLGSDLKLQDRSGMMYLHYSSRFGPIGNAIFGYRQVKTLIGEQVNATGWFRRGIMPWVDLALLKTPSGRRVDSYHRFWTVILGGGAILVGLMLPAFLLG